MVNKFKVLEDNTFLEFSIENTPSNLSGKPIVQSLGCFDKNKKEFFEGDFNIITWSTPSTGREEKVIEIYTRQGIKEIRQEDNGSIPPYFKNIIWENDKLFTEIKGNILLNMEVILEIIPNLDTDKLLSLVLN